MPKPIGLGLQKQVLEIQLVAGLSQNIAPEVAPSGALYKLNNVEIYNLGNAARRHGYTRMSDSVYSIGATFSGNLGIPRKIASKKDELYIITADDVYLGSGGGGASEGDIIWSYSPELDAWKPQAKVGRPTMERWTGVANSGVNPDHGDSCFVSSSLGEQFILLAYIVRNTSGANYPGLHIIVYDAISRVPIIADTVVDTDGSRVETIQVGTKVAVIWFTNSQQNKGLIFDSNNPILGLSTPVILYDAPAGDLNYTCVSDGTSIFMVHQKPLTPGSLNIAKFDSDFTPDFDLTVETDRTTFGFSGAYIFSNRLFYSYIALIAGNFIIKCGSCNINTISSIPAIAVSLLPHPVGDWTCTGVVATSIDDVVVVWEQEAVASISTVTGSNVHNMYWRKINNASISPVVSGILHHCINVSATTHPFVFDNRIFMSVVGMDRENQFRSSSNPNFPYSGYGHALVEFGSHDNATGSVYQTLFPVAVWARDDSTQNGFTSPGTYGSSNRTRGSFGIDSDRYISTLRATRLIDKFGQGGKDPNASGNTTPVVDTATSYGVDIIHLMFDDKKRWQDAELGGVSVLASALPFAYDGSVAHECGHVWRPEVVGLLEDTTNIGVFTIGDEPSYKAVYIWEDINGDTWYSDSSYPAQLPSITGTNSSIDVCIRLPVLSAKPMGGNNSNGRLKVAVYRSMKAAPDDYQKIFEQYVDLYANSNIVMNDTGADDFQGAERAYIVGGETENSCAPPLSSICHHGTRLFGICPDDDSLYYTKEKRFQRGIEWSQYQRLKLPYRGKALGTVESALIVLCEKALYILEGEGPDALGNPVDGYTKLSLLTQEHGCSEQNAAWRIPQGLIFRSYQGLWMVTTSLGLNNIGDEVRDIVNDTQRFVDGSLDVKYARLKLTALMNDGSYKILSFWYDTMRWSVDDVPSPSGTQFSTTVFQGNYYRAVQTGVLKFDNTSYRDDGALYLASVQTGWLRLGGMHNFKRVWRGLATIGKVQNELFDPNLDIQITVENEDGIICQKKFSGRDFIPLSDWSIRAHCFKQKGKAFRITIEELENKDTDALTPESGFANTPYGYTFSCLSLEYGVKRGGAKLPAERS